jgi:hypothetical protein
MLVIPSVNSVPASVALNPSAGASLPAGQASTRLGTSSAPTTAGVAIENNASVFLPLADETTSVVANAASVQFNDASATTNSSQTGSSSQFLAQLLGQDAADDESPVTLAYSATQFAPATEYNRLVAYSYVKYKPSDAGLQASSDTVSLPAVTAASSQNDTSVPVLGGSDYQAYSNTQARNTQSTAFAVLPRLSVAG